MWKMREVIIDSNCFEALSTSFEASFLCYTISDVHASMNGHDLLYKCPLILKIFKPGWEKYLDTDPGPIVIIIRVELFVHKPCKTEDSCNTIV